MSRTETKKKDNSSGEAKYTPKTVSNGAFLHGCLILIEKKV